MKEVQFAKRKVQLKISLIALCTLIIANCGNAAMLCKINVPSRETDTSTFTKNGFRGTWRVTGSSGTTPVSGNSFCASTYGIGAGYNVGGDDTIGGNSCFCQRTAPGGTGPWVFLGYTGTYNIACEDFCPENCGIRFKTFGYFSAAIMS